jgi:hypothetical protein
MDSDSQPFALRISHLQGVPAVCLVDSRQASKVGVHVPCAFEREIDVRVGHLFESSAVFFDLAEAGMPEAALLTACIQA